MNSTKPLNSTSYRGLVLATPELRWYCFGVFSLFGPLSLMILFAFGVHIESEGDIKVPPLFLSSKSLFRILSDTCVSITKAGTPICSAASKSLFFSLRIRSVLFASEVPFTLLAIITPAMLAAVILPVIALSTERWLCLFRKDKTVGGSGFAHSV